jgi:hypothetical protein
VKWEDLYQKLRPWQQRATTDTVGFIQQFQGRPKARLLQSAPTGCGKSFPQLCALLNLRSKNYNVFLMTPSLVIIRGLLEKLGIPLDGSKATLHRLAWEQGITTPVKLRNMIRKGDVGPPDGLIIDETHEFCKGNNVPDFFMAICPLTPLVGFTATPYRGSIRQTAVLKETWPHQNEMVSLKVAISEKWVQWPWIDVVPLVDDDKVKVVDGKFVVSNLDELTFSRAHDLVDMVSDYHSEGYFDKGTVLALPSTKCIHEVGEIFKAKGIKPCVVIQDTSENNRQKAIEDAAERRGVLLQIKVLERGFDESRFRRLIDAKPTLSPVSLVQLWGRVMRPHETSNEVIVTNRNLERHHYLFEGLLPPAKVAAAAEGFGGPSNRFIVRHAGLESLGRFKVLKAPLKGGGTVPFYHLQNWEASKGDNGTLVHYIVVIHPRTHDLIIGSRTGSGRRYTDWKRCEMPNDFKGFQTNSNQDDLHPKIQDWWKGRAGRYGLDRYKYDEIPGRVFQILPFLTEIGVSLRKGG